MGQLALTIPTAGSTSFDVAAANVDSDLQTIQTWANGNIDGANVAATLTGRRMIGQTIVWVPGGTATGNYFVAVDGTLVASASNSPKPLHWWDLDPSLWTVTGKANTNMVLRIAAGVNGAAPGASCAIGAQVNAFTFSGSSGNIAATIGSVQTAGGFGTNGLSANSAAVVESATVAIPTAGAYAPVVAVSGAATAAASTISLMLQLFALNS